MKAIKAVCFDMDGLLFNTEELFDEVGEELLSRRNRSLDPELVKRMMGLQAPLALQLFVDHYELNETVDQLQRETEEIFERILPSRLAPMPGAMELLERLAIADHPLALTTSSGAASVDRIMSLFDIRKYFRFRLTAEDITNSKPHPEIYQRAATLFEVGIEEIVVFEDSENGCKSGVAAGAQVIAVPSKHSELHSYDGAQLVCESLHDPRIMELLDKTHA